MKIIPVYSVILIAAGLSLTACGGGGDSQTNNSSTSSGPITAFGSIYVNGTRYATDSSDVYVEDDLADESDLRVGMMVTIEKDANGNAHAIHYEDEVEGIVLSNSIAAGQTTGVIDVMGQNVTVTPDTIFESYLNTVTDASMIAAGQIVEVSGYSTGMGEITATRLEVKAADLAAYLATHPEGVEVKGMVQNHSAAQSQFEIGNMTVSYTPDVLDGFSAGIENDQYVEVKSVQGIVGGILIASKVEREEKHHEEYVSSEDDEIEIYGVVAAVSADSITVNNTTFVINAQTEFEYGPVSAGDMVEVEGYKDGQGNLVAHEVEKEGYDHSDYQELKGEIQSITIDDTNMGTITLVGGTIIHVNNDSIMHDSRDGTGSKDQTFNLSGLVMGDYVEIYVIANGDGTYTARKVEREDMI